MSADDKASIESEINKVKEALKGTDTNAIKQAKESLTQAFYKVSEKLYQQSGAQGQGPDPNAGFNPNANQAADDVYNADYKVVDEDENNQ